MRSAYLTLEDFFTVRLRRWQRPHLLRLIGPGPETRILDVGGGTGAATSAYTAGSREVVILEPSRKKVDHGRRQRSGIRFAEGTAEEIPFPDGSFDRVVSLASFHHFRDQARGLREIHRVLNEGGRLVIFDVDPGTSQGKVSRFFENDVMGNGCTFSDPARTRDLAVGAGFAEVSVQPVGPGYFLSASKAPAPAQ